MIQHPLRYGGGVFFIKNSWKNLHNLQKRFTFAAHQSLTLFNHVPAPRTI